VYLESASQLAFSADAQTLGDASPRTWDLNEATRALRKKAYIAPEVPSISFSTTGTMLATSTTASPDKGWDFRCFKMAVPRC
jgi:hypothetical protein